MIILKILTWWCEMGNTRIPGAFRSRGTWRSRLFGDCSRWILSNQSLHRPLWTEDRTLSSDQSPCHFSSSLLVLPPLPGANMLLLCSIVTASTGVWCVYVSVCPHQCTVFSGPSVSVYCELPVCDLAYSYVLTYDASEHRVAKGDISESFIQLPTTVTSFLSPHL